MTGTPRVGIVTQARATSTRLPGKVLMQVAGRTLLDHHLDRLEISGLPVLVATTTNRADDRIAQIAADRGLAHYRGSEEDVLARFHGCVVEQGLDVVVRVTSDCPLIDGGLIAEAVAEFAAANDPFLYLSNTIERTFPRGFDFEIFSAAALAEAHARALAPSEREHVTPYFYAGPTPRLRIQDFTLRIDKSGYRVTVDTADDLALVRRLIEDYHASSLDWAGIISLLDDHPELAKLNRSVQKKGSRHW
jgi:spore coat polysaccharide biosynthesis protein SpsF